jgi:bifunctional non-homologous end joining protein LigD
MSNVTPDVLEIDGRRLQLSNRDKLLWPEAGFTKGQMLDYYLEVASALLPHLAGRPITLRRFPNGVDGDNWFQTRCPAGRPDWMRTHRLSGARGQTFDMCLIEDRAALAWVANLAAIELHPLLARSDDSMGADFVVFDLDPGPQADLLDCCEVAIALRRSLEDSGLRSLVKTSGSVGLHIYVPVQATTFARARGFARELAASMVRALPACVTNRKGTGRAGMVLIDWSQNAATKSLIAPYSMRGTGWPTVSTPVSWDEIERSLAGRRPELLVFEASAVLGRLEQVGDLFAGALEPTQQLP